MKIGIVGPTREQRSLPFDAQRSINLFPVFDSQGKEVAAMYSTPGLTEFASAGAGPVRGAFFSTNGRAFIVSGSILYELNSTGTATNRGSLKSSAGNITIDENPTQLLICDGADGYTLTYSSNTFAEITDSDFPTAGTITFLDGYAIVNKVDSGQFFISTLNDGTAWAALDFATAESSPDVLLRVLSGFGQLWLFGEKTSEVWTNTGASNFPFQRIDGAKLETGILAPYSAVSINNNIVWVGRDSFGDGIVYSASGLTPQRISDNTIEKRISEATAPENMVGWVYQQDGHVFYVLTGGGLQTSLVYDFTTQQWHERAYLDGDGDFTQHLGRCHMFAFGKHLVGSRIDGKVYELSLTAYDDAGDALARERVYTHLSQEDERVRYNKLEIGFDSGVGTQTGQGQDPLCSMSLSKDGGRTYSSFYTAKIGKAGNFGTKIAFRRLGIAEQMTFKIRVSDPVPVRIVGSYLK